MILKKFCSPNCIPLPLPNWIGLDGPSQSLGRTCSEELSYGTLSWCVVSSVDSSSSEGGSLMMPWSRPRRAM